MHASVMHTSCCPPFLAIAVLLRGPPLSLFRPGSMPEAPRRYPRQRRFPFRCAPRFSPPRRAALAMADLPQWDDAVWSPGNFFSFTTWWAYHASAAERDDTRDLFILDHYSPPKDYPEFLEFRRPTPDIVYAPQNEEHLRIPTTWCTKEGCDECCRGRSIWTFRWRDKRWTPGCAIGRELRTKEENTAMTKAKWPLGPRPAPEGRSEWEHTDLDAKKHRREESTPPESCVAELWVHGNTIERVAYRPTS